MEKFKKKKISEMSINTRACALAAPGGRARRAEQRKMEKFRKKKMNFRKVEKYSRMRTGVTGGTCAQGPDRGR